MKNSMKIFFVFLGSIVLSLITMPLFGNLYENFFGKVGGSFIVVLENPEYFPGFFIGYLFFFPFFYFIFINKLKFYFFLGILPILLFYGSSFKEIIFIIIILILGIVIGQLISFLKPRLKPPAT